LSSGDVGFQPHQVRNLNTIGVERAIYVRQMNILEKFRTDEESHGAGGWQTCCLVAKARQLAQATQGGESEGTAGGGLILNLR
jgi:hypothetical protein